MVYAWARKRCGKFEFYNLVSMAMSAIISTGMSIHCGWLYTITIRRMGKLEYLVAGLSVM